ncbi:putative copper-activated transcription factor GRISEA [Aspergillus ibericus CBS 121593]|uniref:Copper-fist domain-containing protein n=1 Tax=Aspergillus ibericus CBS 121593 TaxID=1448316 RepID=A0A395GSP6_9EURO|nr:hypothetical protein BO80DRAFT_412077 [Aspergillus ibericus CBS 121593]RAK98611.1 hypothetical protein BO80DRAFT_412077 [Aspergillus ibericus CBS 121593]
MPLDEDGAKWSCEPCIRGHRSSKCQHFDRMMMKVPKAGRPLAKCPHPKGTCSCQKLYAFMIRIPKGSTCLCRPVYQVPADAAESASTTPIPAAPMLSAVPNKVQKPVKRQIKTAPENLTKALNSIPEFRKQHLETGVPNQPPPYAAQKLLSDPYDTVNQVSKSSHNSSHQASEIKTLQGSSCCSRKPQQPAPTPAPQVQRSCCGKPKPPANVENVENEGPVFSSSDYFNSSVFDNGERIYTSPIPQVSTWQDFQAAKQSQYMQPFSLPVSEPGYISMPDPVTHITSKPLAYPHQQHLENYGSFQDSTTQPLSECAQNAASGPANTQSVAEAEATHDCSCGDGCQCLGCASHPFNNTTRQHVREMGLLVSLNGGEQSLDRLNSHISSPLQGQLTDFASLQYPYSNFEHSTGDSAQPIAMHAYSQQSTNASHANSGYSSPPAEYLGQQLMEPSEYYTLEYPVGLPSACADTTGSCQCGNDCTCVGCLTHSGHNGIALEPTMSDADWANMDAPTFSMEAAGANTSQMPALNHFMAYTNSML